MEPRLAQTDVVVVGGGIDGLYLAGDWVGPEGFLVDASVASARRAAELALEDGVAPRGKEVAGSAR